MAFIDNKGKLFGKVSIIDILIVFVVIGAVAGIGYKFTKTGATGALAKPDKIQITLFTSESPEYALSEANAPKGSIVKDGTQGIALGNVKEIKTGKSIFFTPTAQGEFKAASKEGFVSAYIVVEGYGRYTDTGVVINNVNYSVGQQIDNVKVGKSELLRFSTRVYDYKKID